MSDEPTFDPRRKAAIRGLVVSNAAAHPGRAGGRKRAAVIATLVALALGISGGTVAYALGTGLLDPAPGAAPATTTPVPTVTSTPTPTPTQTSTPTTAGPAEDPADPSTWIIRFDGVGPLTLGAPFASQASGLPSVQDITDAICVDGQRNLSAPGGLHFVLVGAADGSAQTAAIELGNYGNGTDNRATTPRTAEGIGVSSTRDELLAAYPDIQRTGGYSDSVDYYGLTDGEGGWIVFGVMDDVVFEIQIGNDAVLPGGQRTVRAIPSERCPA
jgi:hypothetical protein